MPWRLRRGWRSCGCEGGLRSSWAAFPVSSGQNLFPVWCVVGLPLLLPLVLVVGERTGGGGGGHRNGGALRWLLGDRVGRWPPRPQEAAGRGVSGSLTPLLALEEYPTLLGLRGRAAERGGSPRLQTRVWIQRAL